jgi:NADPH:quinone reductase-like Zn-dependent oxidoreductase
MKVWEIHDKPGLEALTQVDRPEPELRPGQVLLKMRAASLNYRDLLNIKQKLPRVPLSDGVGEVMAIGEGVTRVQVGDRVAGTFFQTWLAGEFTAEMMKFALGGTSEGVLAKYVVLSQDGVIAVPDHLTDEAAASLPCAALTAWNALITEGQLKSGDTILIQGTGGVSLFALQFARQVGARVIATSSSDQKLERLIHLGASDGINYKTTPDWDEKVWALTDGRGVDHVVEVGGSGTLNKSLRAVRVGGRISLIGVLTGFSGDISTVSILHKSIRVQGIYVGSREMFAAMNRAIALHQLHPIVDRVFPFDQSPEALAYMESGAHFGKIAIRF